MTNAPQFSFLLLEDNPLDAELEQQRLRDAGLNFDLTIVDTRKSFETAFEDNPYDLILADYSLPEFDGLSALKIVRAKYRRLPFIFVSGVLGEDVAVDTMLQGATDYVLKGKLERLVPAVQRALSEHEDYLLREKAEAELRIAESRALENAERQGLLLTLLQQQRTSASGEALMTTASRQVAEYMKAAQAGFYEVLEDGTVNFLWRWASGEGVSKDGMPLGKFDQNRLDQYRRGEMVVVSDILSIDNANTDALLQVGIRSFVGISITRAGTWRAGFYVAHDTPRVWTDQEALFIREVGEVTWDSVERARAVAALEASEQRLRTAAETANLGSWDLDLTTGRMVCSDQCKANFGWPLDRDFNYADLRASIHLDDLDPMAGEVDKAIASGGAYRAEYRISWPDGSPHWVIAAGRAHYDDGGVPRRMTGFTLDVTERHKAQAALLQSEKLAAVGRLASSIAHEINNPLESVTNLLYLASDATDLEIIKEYLGIADQELRRVAAITNQTLRFHRQSGGGKAVSSNDLLESVLAIFQRRLANAEIEVSVRLRAQQLVKCLDGEIRQVLTNLVGNAIDAMGPRGRLAIRSRDAAHKGVAGVWLTVADDGPGMSASVREKLFEAFFTTKGINGTGLGLWVSQEIVQRHRGVLTFRTSEKARNHGTVFSLFLPCDGPISGMR